MSEQGEKPEVLPGDLITVPGLYESRSQGVVEVRHWDEDGWVAQWADGEKHYFADGTRTGLYPMPDPWQLLHWVGPLPATEPEPETTTEQLAEIEGQAEQPPQPQPIQVREGRWRTRAGDIRNVTPTPEGDGRKERYPWWDAQWYGSWTADGRYHFGAEGPLDLVEYLGPIEEQPQPQPIQVREGRWRTRAGEIVSVSAMPTDDDNFSDAYPWWDGDVATWANNGVFFNGYTAGKDLVEYLGQIEQQPQPVPQPPMLQDADERIRLLKQANDSQAERIGELKEEARILNIEIGGLEQQLSERDARIRDLETIYSAATKSFEDANKANDALRVQVRILQQEASKKASRIEFLETLNAGNGAAIDDYRAKVEKLQGLVDTARGQLEAAATERDQLRAAINQSDKQLDQKDAQIRDLRIELDAAQQVPQPVSDDERERIWDEATEAAGRQVIGWLRPLTRAFNRHPDALFYRMMALTIQVLPDVLPELLGYAVEDESLDTDEDGE